MSGRFGEVRIRRMLFRPLMRKPRAPPAIGRRHLRSAADFCTGSQTERQSLKSSATLSREPARIVPLPVLLLLAACFAIAFATIVGLGCCAQPAKDDYLSAMMFRDRGLIESLRIQYLGHNGRLVSALIMWLSPLQRGSFTGYKLVCIAFSVLFAGSLLLAVWRLLRRTLHRLDRIAVFIVCYVCIHGALGNVAEFYYWLPAISCYGSAALLYLGFLGLLRPALVKNGRRQTASAALAAAAGLGITWCAEPGGVMSIAALTVFGLHARRAKTLSVAGFTTILTALLTGFVAAALSPGNALRMATSPHSRSLAQTLAGGSYTMSGSLVLLVYHMVPAVLFIVFLFQASPYRCRIDTRRFLTFAAITGLFWLSGELLAFYGIGGVPALRVSNSFITLSAFLLTACATLSSRLSPRTPAIMPRRRFVLAACALWIVLGAFQRGNPIRGGAQDLLSGIAGAYDRDMARVYNEASRRPVQGAVLKLSPVRAIPASLFIAQPLILGDEIKGWPWLNVQMAEYFGYKRLYADTLARVPSSDEAFEQWLRGARAAVFAAPQR